MLRRNERKKMKSKKKSSKLHKSVLVNEVLRALRVESAHSKKFIDATVGLGGHSIEIVRAGGEVLGIDADRDSLKIAQERLKNKACPINLTQGNFKDIDTIAQKYGFSLVDGILFDLGISSYQLSVKDRGFSFEEDGAPLDMRMDKESQQVTASDMLNALNIGQLQALFSVSLGKSDSKKLAERVIKTRQTKRIETVGEFREIIKESIRRKPKLDISTLPFLALRMAVNSELDNLKEALPKAYGLLKKGGRLAVISFHSGEDATVKGFFKDLSGKGLGKILYKKPLTPKKSEVGKNPRARSAKLRVIEKI